MICDAPSRWWEPESTADRAAIMDLALSIAAFVVSAVTLGSTYRIWQLSDRRSRIPVLVFVLVDGKGRVLRNVGNGPALNVV